MPRLPPIYSDFFCDLVTEDVEELLARFQQTDSVRYEAFSSVWREMRFSDIFTGITNLGEMKRFCRVTLATAVKFFLPPYSYQIRVGGLYLMFALYNTQLAVPPVKIRLALKDWDQVQKFVKDSVDALHQDVVYIYRRLVAVKAIHYTATAHFLSFQKQRKPKTQPVCTEFLGRTTAVQDLLSSDLLAEVANIQNQYEKLKKGTQEVACSVSMSHQDFASHLRDCMSEFITWQQRTFSQDKDKDKNKNTGADEETPAEDRSSRSSRARLLSSIKNKSYSSFQEASKSRRHRQAQGVDSSSSGAEQAPETVAARRNKALSLRARTWKNLRVPQDEKRQNAWLLSALEKP